MLYLATSRFQIKGEERGSSNDRNMAIGTDGQSGSGAYAIDRVGESVKMKADYSRLRDDGFSDAVWNIRYLVSLLWRRARSLYNTCGL